MEITGVVIRRVVDHLDAAVDFYRSMTSAPVRRFEFAGTELASVGPFLLLPATADERLRRVVATLTVDDLDGVLATVQSLDAEVVAPPTATPNGRRAVVRHPDGGVFEYVGR